MQQITPKELKERLAKDPDLTLLDVREEWERDHFSIGGLHIPMGEVAARISEIPADKDVVVYCEKGIRSVIAIQRLEAHGFKNLFNLAGGTKAWKAEL